MKLHSATVLRAPTELPICLAIATSHAESGRSAGRRLYTFLAECAASGDYTSQLGLISVIRKDFALDLSPQLAGDTWENQIVGQIPGADVPAWQRLAGATMRTRKLVLLDDLSAFQRWAPRIRRFSYQLSRQAPD